VKREPDPEQPIDEREVDDWEVVPFESPREPLSAILTVRFTEREFRKLKAAAKSLGVSMGDLVRKAVASYVESPTSPTVLVMGYDPSQANVLGRWGIRTYGQGVDRPEVSREGMLDPT